MEFSSFEKPFEIEPPRPLLRKELPRAPYPEQALGALLPTVMAVHKSTQAPIAIAAASALATASLAVQGFADVETLGGRRPTSLYFLTIAKSGERKSSCDAPFIAGLRQHEKDKAKERTQAFQSFQNKHAIWKAEKDRILRNLLSKQAKERLEAKVDFEALSAEPDAPPTTDRTVTEPTFEGLTRLFFEGNPSLGIFSDEGGQFLGGHGMNSDNRQKTLAALNDLWGGNPIRRTRQGDGSFTLHGRRLAIHLMVQPTIAHGFMADPLAADTGFLPRFLMCEPSSTIGTRLYSNSYKNQNPILTFDSRLKAILEAEMPMDEETRELYPKLLTLSEGAQSLIIKFADEIEEEQLEGRSLIELTGTASKTAEQAVRIAGVLTLWNDLDAKEVASETMQDAITLAHYYLLEASRLAKSAIVSTQIQESERLREWLFKVWKKPYIIASDILQFGPNKLRDIKLVRKAIQPLVENGWLIQTEPNFVVDGKMRKVAYKVIGN